mmetsp:Transcript_31731/g.75401  ORF Transcript_31731/g.75401 Transcript_31731/m.75401 type:complete len:222 (-) Transcript_31731:896-1561(-)
MQASAAPPKNLPPMKHCGNVLHSVRLESADRYWLPMLSLAYSKESMLITRYLTPMASKSLVMVQQNSQYSRLHTTTASSWLAFSTNATASAVTGGMVMGGGGADGVEAAMASSSSVMSAEIPSKSGVERYRSAPSASITTTLALPLSPSVFESARAPARVPPPEVPDAMPSSRASDLAASIASRPPTCRTSSTRPNAEASSTSFGMKSVVHPWSKCGRHTG